MQWILSAQPGADDAKTAALLDAFTAPPASAGGADDPGTVFDDSGLRGSFQPGAAEPEDLDAWNLHPAQRAGAQQESGGEAEVFAHGASSTVAREMGG